MPMAVTFPFDPVKVLTAWDLTQVLEMKDGYDDEDDSDGDEDVTDNEITRRN